MANPQKMVDVCIIGSGAGGGPLAMELSQAGYSVVVVERGPWIPLADMGDDEIKVKNQRLFGVPPDPQDDVHTYRPDEKSPSVVPGGAFAWTSLCVGGGTTHWSALAWRYHESDFKMRSLHGEIPGANLVDWPIPYGEMEPYYDKAERVMGVSGKAGGDPHEAPRKRAFPMPPLRTRSQGRLFARGCQALGLRSFVAPQAINSESYQGRPACYYCGYCSGYGCEIKAKSGSLFVFLPPALATKRCEIRPHSRAREVTVDEQGRAKSVIYVDRDGKEQEQPARIIIVSCTAVESARLLLNSTSATFPQGLANGSALVGKNAMFHTMGAGAIGLFEEEVSSFIGPVGDHACTDFYETNAKRGFIGGGVLIGFGVGSDVVGFADTRPPGEPTWGAAHKEFQRRNFIRTMRIICIGNDLPQESNRVDLDPEVKDRYGVPVARITRRFHESDEKQARFLAAKAEEILKAAGAVTTWQTRGRPDRARDHQMGTCRMGTDPSRSVLNKFCQAHEVKNLFVVDGSFMPTGGGKNPTLTIVANSFRVADYIKDQVKKRNL